MYMAVTETTEPSVLDGIPPGRYRPPSGTWDEMWDGAVRPHWQGFVDAIGNLGGDELERRRQQAERFLRENGVTFNLHSDDLQDERPWLFDPLPLLLDEASWSRIEAAVAQRARVLDGVLTDLLGPRSLVDRGALPADLVFGPGGLSLPCVGTSGSHGLTLYAADIARGADGQFQVLADHTQAPFGMGYALENRTATTRLFPDIFSDGNVRRLASFFRALHAQLSDRHRNGGAAPRIVVLTPGPRHPTYFEHAYLAAYLGYALVQASDLTVRSGAVWLKSLQGLQRVDVILRRLPDAQCDPLELRGDSAVGVPGLLEAARQGQVAVVNPMGAGVLESPGLLTYLPALAQRVLGEELLLPSAPTWWCGDGEALDHVLNNLPEMVIKSTQSSSEGNGSLFVDQLNDEERERLRSRIEASPHEFVGQQAIGLSTAPSFVDGQLRPRPVVLRVFAVASDDGFLVMPGGLTRSPDDPDATAVPSTGGGVAKDTWILATQPQTHVSLWQHRPESDDVDDPTPALPSQAAENLFWVGRYAERAEATSRLLRTIIETLTQHRDVGDTIGTYRDHLLASLTVLTDTAPGFVGDGAADRLRDPRAEIISVAADAARPGSLAFTLQSLVRAAFAVRDRWSTDSWRVVDDLHEYVWRLGHPGHDSLRWVHEQLDQLITPLSAFTGLNQESMTREPAWILLDMGRRIERALLLTSMIRACLVPRHEKDVDQLLMEAVLMSKESLITYRRRYRSYPQLPRLLELLLLDRHNPRGLAYQLHLLRQHLRYLPGEPSARGVGPVERPLLDADTRLRLAVADDLAGGSRRARRRVRLESLLSVMDERLREAAEILDQRYFRHISDSRQLVPIEPGKAQ